MQKTYRCCLLLFLFFSLCTAHIFAQMPDDEQTFFRKMPPPPPRHDFHGNGMRIPRQDGVFSVIGVKIEGQGDMLVFSLYFNDAIETNSIVASHILLNDRPLPADTEFFFNKVRRKMRFSVPEAVVLQSGNGDFSLKLMYAKSLFGKIMPPTEIKPLAPDAFFKYSRKEESWQRF